MTLEIKQIREFDAKRIATWEQGHAKTLALVEEQFPLVEKDMNREHRMDGDVFENMKEYLSEHEDEIDEAESLRAYLESHFGPVINHYVPMEVREDFWYILGELKDFQYSRQPYRPTVRSFRNSSHFIEAFHVMHDLWVLNVLGISPAQYLTREVEPDILEYMQSEDYWKILYPSSLDNILAARIDAGDEAVIGAIRESILSENNTVIVTRDIIRGVLKGKNSELHDLLAQFLLAARLQEGVRQVICENMDCGRAEAFLTILDVIEKEGLMRFSGVKRAFATWTGICSQYSEDRVFDKLFPLVCQAVRDRRTALEYTRTDDSVQIIVGLWGLGFYEVEDAILRVLEMVQDGSRNQRLTCAYYLNSIYRPSVAGKVAKSVVETFPDDYEMIAAYLPFYLPEPDRLANRAINEGYNHQKRDPDLPMFLEIRVSAYYVDEAEARRHFELLDVIRQGMKKRKLEIAPAIFPWYMVSMTKSDIIERMAITAYMLKDNELIDRICPLITDISVGSYYAVRYRYVKLLLHYPKTDIQRETLLKCVGDKESATRDAAARLVSKLELDDKDVLLLEGMLKYKNEDLRRNIIQILQERGKSASMDSAMRLIQSKSDMVRLAGFDILKNLSEDNEDMKSAVQAVIRNEFPSSDGLTDPEKVLYDALLPTEQEGAEDTDVLKLPGFGLYDVNAYYDPAVPSWSEDDFRSYFRLSKEELDGYFSRIEAFLEDRGTMEYTTAFGEKKILANGLFISKLTSNDEPMTAAYPFPELWTEIYDTIIKEPQVLFNLYFAALAGFEERGIVDYRNFIQAESRVFGDANSTYHIPKGLGTWSGRDMQIVLELIISAKNIQFPIDLGMKMISYAMTLPEDLRRIERNTNNSFLSRPEDKWSAFIDTQSYRYVLHRLIRFQDDDEFRQTFPVLALCNEQFKGMSRFSPFAGRTYGMLNSIAYLKAVDLGIISMDYAYKSMFETLGIPAAIDELNRIIYSKKPWGNRYASFRVYFPEETKKQEINPESSLYQMCKETVEILINLVLDVELKRGDTPTVFTPAVKEMSKIFGVDRLMQILNALGTSKLDRQTYYYFRGQGKTETLSRLLQICYPAKDESWEDFAKAIKANRIKEERVIEVAMYAPQWLEMAEKTLGMPGFQSGCFYFMAHVNQSLSEEKMSMVAKYSPLTAEDFQDGCFDAAWFKDVYETLGEKNFAKLYKAAKYVSDGNKHTRARKYADAAAGKVSRDELEKAIEEKRNKDLLMSYGLIPMVDDADILHRFEFLQKFLRDSKQFGQLRQASEAKCVEMAMKNMARACGYVDDLRLTLAMETELVVANSNYFEENNIMGYRVRIDVGDQGAVTLVIEKDGKKLKAVPATLKKNPNFVELKEFQKKLKSQYKRCVDMFERSMEEEEPYALSELRNIRRNPVVDSIISSLIFRTDNCTRCGLLKDFDDVDGETLLVVAHPRHIYKAQLLSGYQRYFFERQQAMGKKQPFPQVFREFYLKLDEELDGFYSRMFAGHQIQVKMTLGALRKRKWVVDNEDGLQKVYYKKNIIGTIYAMADWFSPSDVEAPTLEYVAFYDRMTGKAIPLSEVPDIIYSEILRDVDLAVSVAHVGGVDPEASHSTIEMRKVVIAFNLELFGLNNVTLEGTHAYIDGKYGKYSVQLGSGVIHKVGGAMINILPVHSQHRGKIFLPFIDPDPKTAEIMSKILLLARDEKIKDPSILDQITR